MEEKITRMQIFLIIVKKIAIYLANRIKNKRSAIILHYYISIVYIKAKQSVQKIYKYSMAAKRARLVKPAGVNITEKLKKYIGKEGEFAFCLTDIVGSSKLWNTMEDQMKYKVRGHVSTGFRLAIECDGYISKIEGDSFFVIFEKYENAIKFGHKMIEENRCCYLKPEIELRVGVAVGKAWVGGGERLMFMGDGVEKVYSLNDMAKPNTVLVDKNICLTNRIECN